ncbi:MAG: hypothetical protein IPJ61_21235 [Tessaracoccus sp.]|uniref:hypothetical protein n=1 Tax=Tessaracoccus sp. TaxID=1971211 RepID=UPI001EB7A068|nr:hypothetical protein [Tessaracoccus sp.]MBK7823513.1 hypothetical protein [Tessaracoccus sp.]
MKVFHLELHDLAIAIAALIIATGAGSSMAPTSPAPSRETAPPTNDPQADARHAVTAAPAQARLLCEAIKCALVVGPRSVRAYPEAKAAGTATLIRPGTVVEPGQIKGRWTWVRSGSDAAGFIETRSLVPGQLAVDSVELYRAYRGYVVARELAAPRPLKLYAARPLRRVIASVTQGQRVMLLETKGNEVVVAVDDGHGGRVIGWTLASDLESPTADASAAPVDAGSANAPPGDEPEPEDVESGDAAPPLPDEPPPSAAPDSKQLLSSGQKAFIAKDYATAIEQAEKVLAVEPGNLTARRLAGLAACENGDRGGGLRHARKLTGPAREKVEKACGARDCAANPVDPRCAQ